VSVMPFSMPTVAIVIAINRIKMDESIFFVFYCEGVLKYSSCSSSSNDK